MPGQRVQVNRSAAKLVPDYVGLFGHIGIGGLSAPHYFSGQYYVTVHLETGAVVTLRLLEHHLDDAPRDFRL
jgi:hypothetical protein